MLSARKVESIVEHLLELFGINQMNRNVISVFSQNEVI